jgi:hypothetical protein
LIFKQDFVIQIFLLYNLLIMKKILGLFLGLFLSLFALNCQTTNKTEITPSENKIAVLGNNWLIKFPPPATNGIAAKNVEYRLLKDTGHPTIAADISPDATTMELSSAAGYSQQGKIYTYNGETISYSSVSGNILQGLIRGRDGTSPQSHSKGQPVYLITMQEKLSDKTEHQIQRLPDNYWVHYRWQDTSKGDESDSLGGFAIAGFAEGTGNVSLPNSPTPIR